MDSPVKSLKERIKETPCFTPWASYGGDFYAWYQWITSQSDMQTIIWNMKTYEAIRLYQVMSSAMQEAHRNHSVHGKVCNYSNHPDDCECGGKVG